MGVAAVDPEWPATPFFSVRFIEVEMRAPVCLWIVVSFAGTKFWGLERTVRLFGAMARWASRLPVPRIQPTVDQIEQRLRRSYTWLPLPVQCLDQAVVGWYLLNRYGHPARLKIGVCLAPLYSHAWVQVHDRILGEIPCLADFKVMAEYPSLDP